MVSRNNRYMSVFYTLATGLSPKVLNFPQTYVKQFSTNIDMYINLYIHNEGLSYFYYPFYLSKFFFKYIYIYITYLTYKHK
jgi:hypothetical protein